MPCTLQAPLSEKMCYSWGVFQTSWAGASGVRDFLFFYFLLFGLSPSTIVWAIQMAGSISVIAWVASATLATPSTYAQYHSSTVTLTCYMSRATLLKYWEKQQQYLGLGMVLLIEHNLAKIDLLIKLIRVIVFPFLSDNNHPLPYTHICQAQPPPPHLGRDLCCG